MSELKPCPFCGRQNIELDSSKELEEYENFEECHSEYYTLVCDWNKGGCGASSGFYPTIKEAIEAWNRRADND